MVDLEVDSDFGVLMEELWGLNWEEKHLGQYF